MPARVDAFAQVFAWLEMRNVLAGERYGFTRFGISTDSRWTEMQRKTAEPADLDALPLRKRVAHQVQEMFHGKLDVLGGKVFLLAGDGFDQF